MPDLQHRLIATATALLAEEGVEAVTLRRIAKDSGVSHSAPLRHFSGRAQLLSAVAAEGFAALGGGPLPDGTPHERLLAACRAYVAFALENPALFELMFRHDLVDTAEPRLAAAAGAVFSRFGALVAAAQATGWRDDATEDALAASLWAALHGLAGLRLWNGVSTDLGQALAVTLGAYLA
ncbi:TetR/AcrR family transcriptional regulator [Amycolatopsis minnesotensis]|uniref:TetR/AcrR family transcriptional regulator n=1 Tax=Amycolatopsis minnesotensis TaxID=337894 RepID=A0ABN2SWP7_9PSEU